jgi:CHAT domain-containing protein
MFSTLSVGTGHLTLYDLYHLRLPARLVILAGAGPGLVAGGEGSEILGLTRGLFYAGARAVLMNQWNVSDPSSAELLKAVCRRLRESPTLGLPSVLQQAMLEVRASHPSPYHWASLALWGAS